MPKGPYTVSPKQKKKIREHSATSEGAKALIREARKHPDYRIGSATGPKLNPNPKRRK